MKIPSHIHVLGDTSYRGDCPTEDYEQATLVSWWRHNYPSVIIFHPNNSYFIKTNQGAVAAKAYAQGQHEGIPDLVICTPKPIFIEMKRKDHTKSAWQKNQLATIEKLMNQGHSVLVSLGAEAAITFLQNNIKTLLQVHD